MNNINLNIRAASQIALLGAVTKNLRAINVIYNEKKLLINFYYEKITLEEEEIPKVFATEMISYFEDYNINVNSIILPKTETLPEEGIRIFCRKE